jgi:hypothetical protein
MTEELQAILLTGITNAKAKFRADRNRLFKSGTKVLSERFFHITTCGITAAHSRIGTIL